MKNTFPWMKRKYYNWLENATEMLTGAGLRV